MTFKNRYIFFFVSLMLLMGISNTFVSCDKLIYDDLSECPQWVDVSFISRTRCQTEPQYIGAQPVVYLFAFDEKDILAGVEVKEQANMNEDFTMRMPLVGPRSYSFVAWAGSALESLAQSAVKVGETTKKELIWKLRSDAPELHGKQLFMGHSELLATLPDPAAEGTSWAEARVNMLELTNRITVRVKLSEEAQLVSSPEDYEVIIKSANGSYNANGELLKGTELITYPHTAPAYPEKGVMEVVFTTLALETGFNSTIELRNTKLNEPVDMRRFNQSDLIGAILMSKEIQQGGYDLMCDHDFELTFNVKQCWEDCITTFWCPSINVGPWTIHTYVVDADEGIY